MQNYCLFVVVAVVWIHASTKTTRPSLLNCHKTCILGNSCPQRSSFYFAMNYRLHEYAQCYLPNLRSIGVLLNVYQSESVTIYWLKSNVIV